ncbi:MAG TPA: hypothetical protein VGI10_31150 [Polyangiaceae bacterium]
MCSLPSVAQAALDSCGGVFVTSAAHCEFKQDQDCQTNCQTVSVEQSCAAVLYNSCSSSCTATSSTQCTETCSPSCTTQCTAAPGSSSDDICLTNCSNDCDTTCAGNAHPDQCHASCMHCCDQKCSERCHTDDQAQACDTKCATACDGTCTATANTDCQISCQSMSFDSCQTTLVQQCQTSCTDQGGAIFCDGQFLNASKLQDCAAELASTVSIHVDLTGSSNVTVATSSGKSSVKCSFAPTRQSDSTMLGATALLALALGIRRRRA